MWRIIRDTNRGAANSTVVFVGRNHGAGQPERIGTAIWRSLNMVAWLSLLIVFLPSLFSGVMALAAPSDSPAVREMGTTYLSIRAFEIPLVMFSAVVWGFLVGRGNSRAPMILAWITVLANVFLDWLLVLGNWGAPALGVAGAAYATVMANGINAILSALILWSTSSRREFNTGRAHLASWAELKGVLQVGLPMGVGDFIEIASFSVFFALLARLGTDILAANQIALQFLSISFTFGIAVSMATSSLVSQNLGAKQPEIAEKVTYRALGLAVAGMGLIGLTYLIAPAQLMGIFSQEQSVIDAGVFVMRLIAFYQVFDALGIVMAGALNGAGDTTFTMAARSIMAWGMFIPLVWLLIYRFDAGLAGAWAGALIYLGGLAFVYLWRFRTGRWKTIELA